MMAQTDSRTRRHLSVLQPPIATLPFTVLPIILFCFFLHVSPSLAAYSCPAQGLSFERCTTDADCIDLTHGRAPVLCGGRNSSGVVLPCGSPDVSLCMCRPFSSHYCRSNLDCFDGEYCAQSSSSGNTLCVSCATHYDVGIGRGVLFDALDYSDTAKRCEPWHDPRSAGSGDGGATTPPCGSGGDFCSATLPCADGYACIEIVDEAIFKCSYESKRCRCALPSIILTGLDGNINTSSNTSRGFRVRRSPISRNNVMFNPCVSDKDCDSEREVCALYSTRNENVCVSCDYARTAYDVVPLTGMGKCNRLKAMGGKQRKQPRMYIEGPNRRTLDRCRTFRHCRPGDRCMRERRPVEAERTSRRVESIETNPLAAAAARQTATNTVLGELEPCNASAHLLCFCWPEKHVTCASRRECPVGETCVTVPRFNLTNNCASTAFLNALPNNLYKLVGVDETVTVAAAAAERRPPSIPEKNAGLTDDPCSFDWDCKGRERRCTHVADLYGRCAGRRQCTCQPLFKRACRKASDCTTAGETCATTIGTRSRPFCTSHTFVHSNPYVFTVNDPVILRDKKMMPTPLPKSNATKGLSEQACLTTADCKGWRTCVHRFEDMAGYKNRNGCDGSRRDCVCKNIGERALTQARCRKSRPYCVEREEVCVMYEDEVPQNRRCVARTAFDEATEMGVQKWVLIK